MGTRYEVIPPVPRGSAWWNVNDTQSDVMENFTIATFSIHMPNAEKEAKTLCDRLNGKIEAGS